MSNKPVHEQFMDRLKKAIETLKLNVRGNDRWYVIKGSNGHRIFVSASTISLPLVETTMPVHLFHGLAKEVRAGERTVVRIDSDPTTVEAALEMLNDADLRIIPRRRPAVDGTLRTKEQLLK